MENGTGGDIDKKDLEPIQEDIGMREKDSGSSDEKGEVIANPSSAPGEGSEDGEEITRM